MLTNIFPKSIYTSDDSYQIDDNLLDIIGKYEKGRTQQFINTLPNIVILGIV